MTIIEIILLIIIVVMSFIAGFTLRVAVYRHDLAKIYQASFETLGKMSIAFIAAFDEMNKLAQQATTKAEDRHNE